MRRCEMRPYGPEEFRGLLDVHQFCIRHFDRPSPRQIIGSPPIPRPQKRVPGDLLGKATQPYIPTLGPDRCMAIDLKSSIKGEVKNKHIPLRLELFLLRSPLDRARSRSALPRQVLGRGAMRPRGLGFLYQRCSSLLGDDACQFRNQQSRTAVKWRP